MSTSLGGFKFVGYRYVTPADPVINDEILKMHKCKLKAFMEANTASGSSWAFSQTSGDYSFGTYGNVIYSIGTVAGANLVSFLRHGSDNAYYCIATFGNMCFDIGYSLQLVNYYHYYDNNSSVHTRATNDMSCSGLDEISPSNVNVDPSSGRLRFYSCNNAVYATSTNSNTIDTIPTTSRDYGYAIKGKTIISFIRDGSASSFCAKVDCIDGLSLCSPNDQANIFSFTTNTTKQTDTTGSYMLENSGSGRQFGWCQVLRGNGARYEPDGTSTTGKNPFIFIMPPQKAVILDGTDNMPYEGALLTPGYLRSLNLLNNDGICGKGQANIDILAVNNVYQYTNITPLSSYANGNYLCLHAYCYSGSTFGNMMYSKTVYCGWDPSNPDITLDASWPVYSE